MRILVLSGDQVDDRWLRHVSSIRNLQRLKLKHTRVTDAGIAQLGENTLLQYVDIFYTPVTDECVAQLGLLKRMRKVRLFGTGVSPAGNEELRKLLPGTEVKYKRGGGLLGVRGVNQVEVCTIQSVQPGTGAAEAGLRQNDVVLAYDDNPVTDFKSLEKLISQNSPGDRVTLKVQRGDQTLYKEVRLGEWD